MPSFRSLHYRPQHLADKAIAVRSMPHLSVPSSTLLDLRSVLAQQMNKAQGVADADATLQLQVLVQQVDELHRSLTIDLPAFQNKPQAASKKAYSSKAIVAAVQSCCLLRDSSDLQSQMRHSLTLMFPEQEAELKTAIERGMLRAPSACSVSRWRVAVDVGFMLCIRDMFRQEQRQAIRCLLTDSSPQRGFDWVLTEWHQLSVQDLRRWCTLMWAMASGCREMRRLKDRVDPC